VDLSPAEKDADRKSKEDEESILAKMRELAIEALKAAGKL
jgi:hypothetical protein